MSQCARVVAALSDGLWHTLEDVHLQVGTMRLNSRVSELRERGYDIVCDKTGGRYKYRLLSKPDAGGPSEPSPSSLAGNGAGSRARDAHARVTAPETSPASEDAAADVLPLTPASAAAQPSLFDLPAPREMYG